MLACLRHFGQDVSGGIEYVCAEGVLMPVRDRVDVDSDLAVMRRNLERLVTWRGTTLVITPKANARTALLLQMALAELATGDVFAVQPWENQGGTDFVRRQCPLIIPISRVLNGA